MRRTIAVLSLAFAAVASAEKPAKAPAKPPPAATKPAESDARHVKVGVTEAGFEPAEIAAKPNESLVLDVTRVTEETCATALVVPDQKTRVDLPLNKEVQVPIRAGANGRVAFGCPMNLMVKGAVVVKE